MRHDDRNDDDHDFLNLKKIPNLNLRLDALLKISFHYTLYLLSQRSNDLKNILNGQRVAILPAKVVSLSTLMALRAPSFFVNITTAHPFNQSKQNVMSLHSSNSKTEIASVLLRSIKQKRDIDKGKQIHHQSIDSIHDIPENDLHCPP